MKYRIIYADPPWPFKNKNTGGNMKSGANAKYKTMSLEDIKNLDIQSISDDNCILFMWWVASQPEEALEVVKAWGFELKTMTGFNWIKLTKLGKLFFGMGFWTRAGSECCLIATKGKPKRISGGVRSVIIDRFNFRSIVKQIIFAKAGKHSQKPNEVRKRIITLCGDIPRIELFAREQREGFDVWGNEVESKIQL